MTKYIAGQDVEVCFDGIWSRGEILWHRRGWCCATIIPDVTADYGGITPMLGPRSTVCVPDSDVRVIVNH